MRISFCYIGLMFLLACASKSHEDIASLPVLPFDVTGSAEAMPDFQKGLLLLHNFEYEEAAASFREAQHKDSAFTMAYWGEAMTYNHTVWGDLDIDKSRAALKRLAPTAEERVAKAATPMEKGFIQAINVLFEEGPSKPDRDKAYAVQMQEVYTNNPGNHEAAAFYALALLATKKSWSLADSLNDKSAEIVKAILKENPRHPGALHYLIHADDHPDLADRALEAAHSYAVEASYSAHALHMPSHIYLALGMWDRVVSSNEVAWQASIDKVQKQRLTNDDLSYHTHLWLQYGYLQRGQFSKAYNTLREQIRYTRELPSTEARFHLMVMKGQYLEETDQWTDSLADIPVNTDDMQFLFRSANRWINASKAFHRKDQAALPPIIAEMEKDQTYSEQRLATSDNITVCGVKPLKDKVPTKGEIRLSALMMLEVKGMDAWLRNDLAAAEKFFLAAVEKETSPHIGPPVVIKPANEYIGDFFLANNKPQEALKHYEAALKYSPGRIHSLKGEWQAAQQLHDTERANALKEKLNTILKDADPSVKNSTAAFIP
ncbi:MAG TPA: hypothetical protein VIN08_11755, partial [Ohtaekwangia sp.]|uniref:hypothetical protein n=1 Tax=Ohtaekwangia sp. TaxID=2066019 RepID=UPI002F9250D3